MTKIRIPIGEILKKELGIDIEAMETEEEIQEVVDFLRALIKANGGKDITLIKIKS